MPNRERPWCFRRAHSRVWLVGLTEVWVYSGTSVIRTLQNKDTSKIGTFHKVPTQYITVLINLWNKDTSIIKDTSWGPNGVISREVPLYTHKSWQKPLTFSVYLLSVCLSTFLFVYLSIPLQIHSLHTLRTGVQGEQVEKSWSLDDTQFRALADVRWFVC